jgi:transposase-like protein
MGTVAEPFFMVKRKPKPARDFSHRFCINESCEDYGVRGKGNIVFRRYYGKNKDRVLLVCRTCKTEFAETRGTPFFGLHTDQGTVITALKMLMEKAGIRGTARALGVDKDSVQRWLEHAGRHCDELRDYLLHDQGFTQAQVDELYTFIQKRAQERRKKAPSGS